MPDLFRSSLPNGSWGRSAPSGDGAYTNGELVIKSSSTTAGSGRAKVVVLAFGLAFVLGLILGGAGALERPTPASAGDLVRSPTGVARGRAADALPTVQVNGIVWTQVVVGNTVYAGGRFSAARPAGAAPGRNAVRRSNLLAFDIRTGRLITLVRADGERRRSRSGRVTRQADALPRRLFHLGERQEAVALRCGLHRRWRSPSRIAPAFDNEVRAILGHILDGLRRRWLSARSDRPSGGLASISAASGKPRAWKPRANSNVQALTLTPDRRFDRRRRLVLGRSAGKPRAG